MKTMQLANDAKAIGMDMAAPYRVYIDGAQVAEFATEHDANALYAV
jgi:hypothetical protein